MAKSSAGELRSQAYLALDLHYVTLEELKPLYDLADKVARQLARFIAYLESRPQAPRVREDSGVYEV